MSMSERRDRPSRERLGTREAPADAVPAVDVLPPVEVRRERGYRVANAVSYILNPLVLPPIGFGLVQAHLGAGLLEIVWTVGISFVFFCLVPLFYVLGMVRLGGAPKAWRCAIRRVASDHFWWAFFRTPSACSC